MKEIERNPSNVFVTEAVSGAGASNVGVAGSVAIAVINGTTKAYIGDSANVITATGDIIINADARQSESTTGSAAVGNDGKADKNLSGGNSGTESDSTVEEDPSKLHDIVIRPLNPSGNVNGAVGSLFVTTPSKTGESKAFSKANLKTSTCPRSSGRWNAAEGRLTCICLYIRWKESYQKDRNL